MGCAISLRADAADASFAGRLTGWMCPRAQRQPLANRAECARTRQPSAGRGNGRSRGGTIMPQGRASVRTESSGLDRAVARLSDCSVSDGTNLQTPARSGASRGGLFSFRPPPCADPARPGPGWLMRYYDTLKRKSLNLLRFSVICPVRSILTRPTNVRIHPPARRCVVPDAAAPRFQRHRHGNRP